jgi:hypothetical protein
VTAAPPTGSEARPVVLFVLGMARSGTSAITRVLSLCGGALPEGMLGAMRGNPSGHWESRAAVSLNDKILHRNGGGWYDPTLRLEEEGAFDAKEYAACVAEIRTFLTTLPAAPLVVLKDPKITVLSGLWFEAARMAGLDVVTVIALRHPHEVIASLTAPGGVSSELSSALWLKYTLLAERNTRALPRVFVDYANLLDDWRRETARISAALAIDLNTQDEGAVEEFLTPDLHRQRHSGAMTEPFGTDWFSVVYEELQAAARDDSWDQSALDRVFEAYGTSEQTFRTASGDFQRLQKINRLFRPSFTKLFYEVRAMAQRRSGTWA